MEIGNAILGFETIDLLLVGFFGAFFVLGFAQGTIRRLIGIASILFSFLFAANLSGSLGHFLGANWTQFSPQYAQMIGFLIMFIGGAVILAVLAQGFYKPQPLFRKARFVDEILGGILGVIQAGLILLCIVVILDTFFYASGIPSSPNELRFLRESYDALHNSQIVAFFRESIIPVFMTVFAFFVPTTVSGLY